MIISSKKTVTIDHPIILFLRIVRLEIDTFSQMISDASGAAASSSFSPNISRAFPSGWYEMLPKMLLEVSKYLKHLS